VAVRSQEELYASLQRGMRATADLAIAKPLLAERREALIRQAIMDFQAKKLDGQGALLFVAAIVENQRLVDDLEHAERQGQRAGTTLNRS
jgi:hypothetical protein